MGHRVYRRVLAVFPRHHERMQLRVDEQIRDQVISCEGHQDDLQVTKLAFRVFVDTFGSLPQLPEGDRILDEDIHGHQRIVGVPPGEDPHPVLLHPSSSHAEILEVGRIDRELRTHAQRSERCGRRSHSNTGSNLTTVRLSTGLGTRPGNERPCKPYDQDALAAEVGLGDMPGRHCSTDPSSGARSRHVRRHRFPVKLVAAHQK